MLRCDYCGRENNSTARWCAECGTELPEAKTPSVDETEPLISIPCPQWIDLAKIQGAFSFDAGFSRPDWEVIARAISASVLPLEHRAAWQEIAWQWLDQLRQDLGGNYRICNSADFLLLSNVSHATAERILRSAEHAVVIIRELLGDLAWRDNCGKQPILMFSDDDDYYHYISVFWASDNIPASMGVHVSQGFPHIALKAGTEQQDCMVIAHELAHNCLLHLPIPLWLNEGVSQRLERAISNRSSAGSSAIMSHDLAERHQAFWTEENIQAFWAGTLFHCPAEGAQELSYSLAEVLVHLLSEDRASFFDFLSCAKDADAGQTAALDCFGKDLGDVAASFLGEGNWRPIRKSMVQCWEKENWSTWSDSKAEILVKDILARDSHYSKEAYLFVLAGCKKAFKKAKTHVSAVQVLAALREHAVTTYGSEAKSVLKSWGVFKCADFGEIVFNLIDAKLLSKTPEDSKADFIPGYDFDTAFPSD